MEIVKEEEVMFNLKVLKRIRVYQIFEHSGIKIFNRNVYWILNMLLTAVTQCATAYGILGYFLGYWDHSLNLINNFLNLFITIHGFHVTFMIIIILTNSNIIWDLFHVTKFDFLTSKIFAQNIELLQKYRKSSMQTTYVYFGFIVSPIIQWMLNPFMLYMFTKNENANNLRIQNIFNFPYPVKTFTYNHYYILFYFLEVAIAFMLIYNMIIVDCILISFYYALIGQYKLIAQSFLNLGIENKTQKEEYNDLRSILANQQKLDLKLKSFYMVFRPIILSYIAITSILIVLITYSSISVCLSISSFSIMDVIKLFSTAIYEYVHAFVLCFVFENMYTEVNSINHAMYSCNWTKMDLKFKELLLFSIRMNNANQSVMKFSPKKIVNLQLFASIVMTSYNIVSVMINTINKHQLNSE